MNEWTVVSGYRIQVVFLKKLDPRFLVILKWGKQHFLFKASHIYPHNRRVLLGWLVIMFINHYQTAGNVKTYAYLLNFRFIHWLLPAYLLIDILTNKTNERTAIQCIYFPQVSPKYMNIPFKLCFLSSLHIQFFIGKWLLTKQHISRGPSLCITNW
jgi:hypothetical protein